MAILVYGKHLRDLNNAVFFCMKAYLDSNFTVFCERTEGRNAFRAMLEHVKEGDIVFINAIQTLRDYAHNNANTIKRIRQIKEKGAILQVGLQSNFTYDDYERWYAVNKEIEDWETIYSCHMDVGDREIELLDIDEEVSDMPFGRWVIEDNYYLWY